MEVLPRATAEGKRLKKIEVRVQVLVVELQHFTVTVTRRRRRRSGEAVRISGWEVQGGGISPR